MVKPVTETSSPCFPREIAEDGQTNYEIIKIVYTQRNLLEATATQDMMLMKQGNLILLKIWHH